MESDVDAEVERMAQADDSFHEPVTDGSVDVDRYAASRPRILWILKEPWEELSEGEKGGGWSVSKHVAAKGITKNRGALPMMAYVSYSIANGFPGYDDMPWAASSAEVADSLKRIAIVNIKKSPGKKTSYPPEIARHYARNRSLLLRQIKILRPEIIIGGNTLFHFFADLELSAEDFNKERSAWFLSHSGTLFIHAAHPARRGSNRVYVDEIVSIIKENYAPLDGTTI